MKKFFGVLLCLAIVFAYTGTVRADVNDFTITKYQMDLYLGRDDDGRSTLNTKERITARFPASDQNHGIERAIPKVYDGHSTSLEIESVEDLLNPNSSMSTPYSTYTSNDNEVLRVGDPDTYVHGTHEYLLTYTQRDVTRYVNEAGFMGDEFYWDTNGTEWRVPIEQLTVRLHIHESLKSSLMSERTACYAGYVDSNDECQLMEEDGTYVVRATDLSSGQNVTIALAFEPRTFAAYEPSLLERLFTIWGIVTIASIPITIGIAAWLVYRWHRLRNRRSDVGTVVPEYVPPRDMSVTAAAEVLDMPRNVMTAQILDLAVRHYIKIIQTRERSTFKKAEYDLEIIRSIDDLSWEEQELLRDLFSGSVDVGSRMSMKTLQSSTAFYTRMQNNPGELKKKVRGEYALRVKSVEHTAWFKKTATILLVLAILLLSPVFLAVAVLSFALGLTLWQLTDKGVELRRYLLGLKEYIEVAETERLKMLQSPEGASKVGEVVDVKSSDQLVKLYERVLPYAVLFGQEKEWNKQLGAYYEAAHTQPSWYGGNASAFNAAMFTSSMNSFSASANYVSPSNSSSGGSGGGGFSGGGGGGGGGGGW